MAVLPISVSIFQLYLQRVPLLARLRSDLSVQELLEVGDALLAAPILIVEIGLDFADAYATIGEFRRRYGDHLLIGAAEVVTSVQLQAARAAGAHYFALPRPNADLLRFARQHDLFCLPHVSTPAATRLAALEGCSIVSVDAVELAAYSTGQWPTGVSLVVNGVVDEATLAACRAAEVAAVRLQETLFPTAAWSPAELIITARKWRESWERDPIPKP